MSDCSGRRCYHIQEAGEGNVGQTKDSAISIGVFVICNRRRISRGKYFEASIRGSSEVNILLRCYFVDNSHVVHVSACVDGGDYCCLGLLASDVVLICLLFRQLALSFPMPTPLSLTFFIQHTQIPLKTQN
jgi:hypothetical protein